ncbi:hypothetical protein [Rathayibacter toxicus]|uniref:hypothetical protein n=1 Tax=Rathayibacter toxicus TaxID=145458 RepID=UPI0012DDD71C|nr:hypothetical protein [Rathayibacter toxicus]QOD11304.1 hypothetical protein BSG36_05035 [Rathayibacter toxicus]
MYRGSAQAHSRGMDYEYDHIRSATGDGPRVTYYKAHEEEKTQPRPGSSNG